MFLPFEWRENQQSHSAAVGSTRRLDAVIQQSYRLQTLVAAGAVMAMAILCLRLQPYLPCFLAYHSASFIDVSDI